MDEDYDKALEKRYPVLYRMRRRPLTASTFASGCSCESGWLPLIDAACECLDDGCTEISDIKQKFGALIIRTARTDGADRMYEAGVAAMARALSLYVCEICGDPGVRRQNGMVQTLCPAHGGGVPDFSLLEPATIGDWPETYAWVVKLFACEFKEQLCPTQPGRPIDIAAHFDRDCSGNLKIALPQPMITRKMRGAIDFVTAVLKRLDPATGSFWSICWLNYCHQPAALQVLPDFRKLGALIQHRHARILTPRSVLPERGWFYVLDTALATFARYGHTESVMDITTEAGALILNHDEPEPRGGAGNAIASVAHELSMCICRICGRPAECPAARCPEHGGRPYLSLQDFELDPALRDHHPGWRHILDAASRLHRKLRLMQPDAQPELPLFALNVQEDPTDQPFFMFRQAAPDKLSIGQRAGLEMLNSLLARIDPRTGAPTG